VDCIQAFFWCTFLAGFGALLEIFPISVRVGLLGAHKLSKIAGIILATPSLQRSCTMEQTILEQRTNKNKKSLIKLLRYNKS